MDQPMNHLLAGSLAGAGIALTIGLILATGHLAMDTFENVLNWFADRIGEAATVVLFLTVLGALVGLAYAALLGVK
jgi:hypothetical protein